MRSARPALCLCAALVASCTEFNDGQRYLGQGGSGGSIHGSSSSTAGGEPATGSGGMAGVGGSTSSPPGSGGMGGVGGTGVSSGGSGGTGGGSCITPCDCDGDGHEDVACGGDDCADHDGRAFPGQTMFFPDPIQGPRDVGTPAFDFNCDGADTYGMPSVVSCTTSSCSVAQGWMDQAPDCGQVGTLVDCTGLCSMTVVGSMAQACN